ncbi:hypothetical protein AUJ66_05250 [Candidatus Desantisbacteria bacterium CG1_02_38_46]|uniref:AAA domain-containing protein n=3 Tax=unclassified Candidatus Desantisiibacteriota TaxID=3106372 RepID=A0A2H9PDM2_9BACT|nr:MAG: hypothetical protein AUJ66_05250 [Candidatus Desantisbacteria bacterium CG1_02_38_46]PIU52179.1 MAG: hypothetical protein COS91_00565 [Candidatus Desantisbacteria bacterium CG07_land_8_20_14_0_80_39_15]PIZ16892.1 MAG: hypothetical protein COY51_01690 [Candidatus Desantisbacteria bacterium CG_4_10_14_0_8_um_filter_39_17]
MGKIISITNQKGGVGKTTTSVNLGACLAMVAKKILLVDIDPQANTTGGLGFDKNNLTETVYEVLIDEHPVEQAILKYEKILGLEIIPSGIQLAGAPVELVGLENREARLRDCLLPLKDKYDFIFIDCPPSLGLLTINGLDAADSVLIPVQCEYYALEGLSQLLQTINLVKGSFNPELGIEGFLLTMHNTRTKLSFEIIEEVKNYFKDKVYNTLIPRNVRLSEAPSYGEPIILYDSSCRGAQTYEEFAREFLEKNKGKD